MIWSAFASGRVRVIFQSNARKRLTDMNGSARRTMYDLQCDFLGKRSLLRKCFKIRPILLHCCRHCTIFS